MTKRKQQRTKLNEKARRIITVKRRVKVDSLALKEESINMTNLVKTLFPRDSDSAFVFNNACNLYLKRHLHVDLRLGTCI